MPLADSRLRASSVQKGSTKGFQRSRLVSDQDVATISGHTFAAVRTRRIGRDLRDPSVRARWTAQERCLLGTASDQEISRQINRTVSAVKSMLKVFKIPAWKATLARCWLSGGRVRSKAGRALAKMCGILCRELSLGVFVLAFRVLFSVQSEAEAQLSACSCRRGRRVRVRLPLCSSAARRGRLLAPSRSAVA
jgi:hypothetical protein